MANVVAPMGFQLARASIGGSAIGMANTYYIPSGDTNAYYIGDVVKSAAGTDTVNGFPQIQPCTGGTGDTEFVRGVIVGVYPTPNLGSTPNLQGTPLALEQIYVPATKSRAYYVLVQDDPSAVYEVQDDGLGSTTLATIAGYASKNASFTVTAPSNALIPISATVLNTSTIATTSTLPLKILGLLQSQAPGGGNQLAPYAKWLVRFNSHELAQQSAGV